MPGLFSTQSSTLSEHSHSTTTILVASLPFSIQITNTNCCAFCHLFLTHPVALIGKCRSAKNEYRGNNDQKQRYHGDPAAQDG